MRLISRLWPGCWATRSESPVLADKDVVRVHHYRQGPFTMSRSHLLGVPCRMCNKQRKTSAPSSPPTPGPQERPGPS